MQDAGVNLRAFGAGTDATLATLRVIDPAARIFTSGPQLSAFFLGFTSGSAATEPGLAGGYPYLDLNGDGRLGAGEPTQQTAFDDPFTDDVDETGVYFFADLGAGSYTVRQIMPPGYVPTYPDGDNSYHLALSDRAVCAGNNFGDTQLASGNSGSISLLLDLTNSVWRFFPNGNEPTGWKEQAFDDSAWPAGRGLRV